MTTEEIHNSNIDNEDIKRIKYFAYLGSIIKSNKDCSQKIKGRLKLRRL